VWKAPTTPSLWSAVRQVPALAPHSRGRTWSRGTARNAIVVDSSAACRGSGERSVRHRLPCRWRTSIRGSSPPDRPASHARTKAVRSGCAIHWYGRSISSRGKSPAERSGIHRLILSPRGQRIVLTVACCRPSDQRGRRLHRYSRQLRGDVRRRRVPGNQAVPLGFRHDDRLNLRLLLLRGHAVLRRAVASVASCAMAQPERYPQRPKPIVAARMYTSVISARTRDRSPRVAAGWRRSVTRPSKPRDGPGRAHFPPRNCRPDSVTAKD